MRKDQEDSTGLNVFKCYNGCWSEVGRINFCLLCYNLIVCQEGWVLRPCGGGGGAEQATSAPRVTHHPASAFAYGRARTRRGAPAESTPAHRFVTE